MKYTSLLFIVLLVGSTIATTEEEVYQTIAKMENSKFGKTLIDTIAL
jgi:hypothetical protein